MKHFVLMLAVAAAPALYGIHIGFLHPSGGERGTTVDVIVGGRGLHTIKSGVISGEGVKIKNITIVPNVPNVSGKQLIYLKKYLRAILENKERPQKPEDTSDWRKCSYFDKMDELTPLQRAILTEEIFKKRNSLQMSPALRQRAIITLEIAPDAPSGKRELRLNNNWTGLSNPVPFFVGKVPEIVEPLLPLPPDKKTVPQLKLPCTVNGQIMPGESDRWNFEAKKGAVYSFQLHGRELTPFMGDCVPGHFQPVIEIFNAAGKSVAFADDFGTDPDPTLNFTVPANGSYTVEVRDALYRGREDFCYRLEILRGKKYFNLRQPEKLPIPREVKNLTGKMVKHPLMVHGVIGKKGVKHTYLVNLTAGETFVAEVSARKLGSPMDSKLVLRDSTGKIVAENDDAPRVLAGTVLHQADSRITYKAASAGVYTVEISDNAGRGGDMYRYWLRLDKPRPRFNIYAAPSGISVSAPHETPVYILVEYLDGFDGEITLVNPSKQLVWSGVNRIPRGTKESVVTLTSPAYSKRLHPQRLMFYARGGKYITQVKPADRAMQAFAYTHYQPSNSFFIARSYDKSFANMFRFEENIEPDWQIVAGERLDIKICRNGNVPANAKIAFDLPDAPAGLKISEVKQLTDGWNVTVATAEKMKAQEFNQLLRVTLNYELTKKGKTRKIRKQLYLPVCRFEILTEEVKK